MEDQSLIAKLRKLDSLPLHMPGHKRNMALLKKYEDLKEIPFNLDITEIEGYDDLHNSKSILKAAMDKASLIWKAKKSFFLVNGSTGGILSAIYSVNGKNSKILLARNCHKSVYHAVELFDLEPVFILPDKCEESGIFLGLKVEAVRKIIEENPDAKSLVITSPTYEGIMSDIRKIADLCHSKGMVLIVDEAHGAHLGHSKHFKEGAVKSCADIVIQSLHKTLFSLTQTAIIHVNGNLVDLEKLERALGIFQTSSPSYILMASIDSCVNLLREKSIFSDWNTCIELFEKRTQGLKKLKLLFRSLDNFDRSKLLVYCGNTNISGVELSDLLRSKYKIEVEMASKNYILAMTGLGEIRSNILKFADALIEIDKGLKIKPQNGGEIVSYSLPKKAIPIGLSLDSDKVLVEKEGGIGKISGQYIWAYPPGIPIICPGEIFSKDIVDMIKNYEDLGINLIYTGGKSKKKLLVLDN